MKKIFKYGTGEVIPEGAIYLSTQVETKSYECQGTNYSKFIITENTYVWHYFLVEEK